jgi:hypothetical protein
MTFTIFQGIPDSWERSGVLAPAPATENLTTPRFYFRFSSIEYRDVWVCSPMYSMRDHRPAILAPCLRVILTLCGTAWLN